MELKDSEDKEELEEARRNRAAAAATAANTGASLSAEVPHSKPTVAQRIGFTKGSSK